MDESAAEYWAAVAQGQFAWAFLWSCAYHEEAKTFTEDEAWDIVTEWASAEVARLVARGRLVLTLN